MINTDINPLPPTLSIALAGNPNAGKSTLFNALTGARQHVGNWPGKTIEKKTGELHHDGRRLAITDLPGAYSLSAYTLEEVVARDFLLRERPDVVVAVADASNLERNLYLIVQLLELGLPTVVVLNMMDAAERQGLSIALDELSRALAAPVLPAVARREEGLDDVIATVCRVAADNAESFRLDYGPAIEAEIARLELLIAAHPTGREIGSPRWLAVRLLEGDSDAAQRLSGPAAEELHRAAAMGRARLAADLGDETDLLIADRRYTWIHDLAGRVINEDRPEAVSRSDRIDRIVTNRWLGIPIFLVAMWFVFKITTDLSAPWVDWLDGVLTGPISRWVVSILGLLGLSEGWFASLLVDGVLGGVGSVLAFIPVLLSLYFALAVLEDSGYMARGAFVMDRLMNRIGLHGRSFLPLMVGFGCSVPAIYATRTLSNRRDRVLTGLLVPFMSCSARLPVYVLFAAIFFPGAASLVILGLYLLGIAVAIVVGLLLQRTLLPATAAPGLVMELPPYRLPNARSIRYHMWLRTRAFLEHAASLILLTTLVIWLLTAIPWGGSGTFAQTPMAESVFGRVSTAAAPVLRPLGFGSWQSGGALLSGLVAKEVVVSTLGQIYGVESAADETGDTTFLGDLAEIVTSFGRAVADTLRALPGLIGINLQREEAEDTAGLAGAIRAGFDESSGGHATAAGLAFMVFVLLYTPCMAAIAAERHELGAGWSWFSLIGQLIIAWLMAFVVFRAGVWLGGI
ncbi:Ferrous iron transport protein B domain protein (modular protein) [Candidatus Promineifilum breve]|uniref:Ferrous iron transport protein B n=1 Tax=Candidatus Promineifilum breve TaxID=1806508 RepID=A0A160T4H0_9CHLR|nr:ferrous iron transport protein B [Candidatus Promineifilum breve]CUS05171.2 Ferrous iron transport protein B domain protein (modular protein) [Candidatus Promineifilum breve]